MSDNWINIIPSDWTLLRLGSIFNLRNQKVSDKDYLPLSVSRGGVVPQMENVAKSDASDDRKLVLKGDFAINSRSDRKQSCGVAPMDGSVSLINLILYCKDNESIYTPYLNYLLKNYGFAEEFYKWGHGIVADLWTTRWQEMKSILLPIPSINEQKEIAIILDAKISQLDSLISNQEKQIAKLEEYKQAIITKAVTKGLNPNVKMKDSGVEWIGEIPEKWQLPKFKNLATLSNGKEIENDGGDIPVYGSGGIFKWTNKPLFEGVSLLTGRKGTIDNPMLVDGKFWTVDTMFYTSQIYEQYIYPKYLFYAFKGCCNFKFYKSGSVLPSMTQSQINAISIPLPSKEEQKNIISFLEKEMPILENIITLKTNKIEELNAYKKSLIYEYVTGKKRVI